MNFLFLGLSITSSWGNGHATTYRGLLRELHRRGHGVTFLERDVPWYREHRDLPHPSYARTLLYRDLEQLRSHQPLIKAADAVVLGSYLPEGPAVIDWVQRTARGVLAFYDIDTPITLAALEAGRCEYLERRQVPRFDLYLSFTGGPTLTRLERAFGARHARPLYCSVDPGLYYPEAGAPAWALGYLGTYSEDRQPVLQELLLKPAELLREAAFVVGGAQYPDSDGWPDNVEHLPHVAPAQHRSFYNRQRFTLNITRREMVRAGYSPSVRLFEAAACGVPIISDVWLGLETILDKGEVLLARSAADVVGYLRDLPEAERIAVGRAGRARILAHHTAAHRALELEQYVSALQHGVEARAEQTAASAGGAEV